MFRSNADIARSVVDGCLSCLLPIRTTRNVDDLDRRQPSRRRKPNQPRNLARFMTDKTSSCRYGTVSIRYSRSRGRRGSVPQHTRSTMAAASTLLRHGLASTRSVRAPSKLAPRFAVTAPLATRSHYTYDSPGSHPAEQERIHRWQHHRDFAQRAFTVGIGGPVGSGKVGICLFW